MKKIYLILNKPSGVLISMNSQDQRKTLKDLFFFNNFKNIFPVGRLDYNTKGAIILTNDGILANKIIKEEYKIPREYLVKVKGIPSKKDILKLRKGIFLPTGPTKQSLIYIIGTTKTKNSWLKVILFNGKNKQIVNMFWRIKTPVIKIIRTKFANISINKMNFGEYRLLSNSEIIMLKNYVEQRGD